MITAASDKTGGPGRPPAALSVYGLRDRNRAAAVPAMMIALSSGAVPTPVTLRTTARRGSGIRACLGPATP